MNNKLYTKNSIKILNNNYDNLYYMIINKRLITKCLYNVILDVTKIEISQIYYYITGILGYPFNHRFIRCNFVIEFKDFLDLLYKLNIAFISKIEIQTYKRLLFLSNSYLNLPKLLITYDETGYKLYNHYDLNNKPSVYVDYNYYKANEITYFKLMTPIIKLIPRHSLNKLLDIYPNLPIKHKTVSEKEFKEYILGIDHSYLLNYRGNDEGTQIEIDNPSFNYGSFNNIVTHIELRVRQLHYIMENNPFAILIYPTLKKNFDNYIINGRINKLNDYKLMSFQTLGKGIGWQDSNIYLYVYLDKKLIDLAVKYYDRIRFNRIPDVLEINEYCLWGANSGNVYDSGGGGGQADIIRKAMDKENTLGHDFGIVTMCDNNINVLSIN